MNAVLLRDTATWAFWRLFGAALIVAATAVVASAQYCTPDQCDECNLKNCRLSCCHESPDLWEFNTRCVPKCNNLDEGFEHIRIRHWDPTCRRWTRETLESFLAQEASMPTLIFAHGNTLQDKGAMKQCWFLYGKMRCCPGKKRLGVLELAGADRHQATDPPPAEAHHGQLANQVRVLRIPGLLHGQAGPAHEHDPARHGGRS